MPTQCIHNTRIHNTFTVLRTVNCVDFKSLISTAQFLSSVVVHIESNVKRVPQVECLWHTQLKRISKTGDGFFQRKISADNDMLLYCGVAYLLEKI